MAHHPNKDQDIFITAVILYGILFTMIPAGIYRYIVIAALLVIDAGLYWYFKPAAAHKVVRRTSRTGVGHKSRHSKSIRPVRRDQWYSDNVSIGPNDNFAYLDRQFYDVKYGGGGRYGGNMTGGATWMYQDRMFNGRGLGQCTRWSYDKAFQRQAPAHDFKPSVNILPPTAQDPLMIDTRDRVHELEPYNDAASIVYDMASCHEDTVSTMSVDLDA
jgi:hypothetical protein